MKTPSAKSHPVRSALLWFGVSFVLLAVLLVLSVCLPLLFNKTSLFPPRFFPSSPIGYENYLRLILRDDVFWKALRNTYSTALCALIVGLVAGLLLSKPASRLHGKARRLLFILCGTGTLALLCALLFFRDWYNFFGALLVRLHILSSPANLYTETGVLLVFRTIAGILLMTGGFLLCFMLTDRLQTPALKNGLRYGSVPLLFLLAVWLIPPAVSVIGAPSSDYAAHTVIQHISDYGTASWAAAPLPFPLLFTALLIGWFAAFGLWAVETALASRRRNRDTAEEQAP